MDINRGTTEDGTPWTCIMDHNGFHFSLSIGEDVLSETVHSNQMTRDDFYAKIKELEDELKQGFLPPIEASIDEEDKLQPMDDMETV